MPNYRFTVVSDYGGGTYVSQFEARDAVHVAEQWAAMIRSDKPIPRSSAHIANRVARDLGTGCGPVALQGLKNVWQMGGQAGQAYYTATIVQSS